MTLNTGPGGSPLQWGRDRMAAERRVELVARALWVELQWGRDRMAAERTYASLASGVSERLQWGRDRMAAERGLWGDAVPQVDLASMGPRPDGRGTAGAGKLTSARGRLQWGRDRMAAERISCWAPPFQTGGLQWGRDRMAAERCDLAGSPWAAELLQWGRDRMAAERQWGRSRQQRTISFNGAATGWPRNGKACPGCVAPYGLQWGRDRMAAERWRPAR